MLWLWLKNLAGFRTNLIYKNFLKDSFHYYCLFISIYISICINFILFLYLTSIRKLKRMFSLKIHVQIHRVRENYTKIIFKIMKSLNMLYILSKERWSHVKWLLFEIFFGDFCILFSHCFWDCSKIYMPWYLKLECPLDTLSWYSKQSPVGMRSTQSKS